MLRPQPECECRREVEAVQEGKCPDNPPEELVFLISRLVDRAWQRSYPQVLFNGDARPFGEVLSDAIDDARVEEKVQSEIGYVSSHAEADECDETEEQAHERSVRR